MTDPQPTPAALAALDTDELQRLATTYKAALAAPNYDGIEARTKTARFLLNSIVGPGGLSDEAPVVLLLRQMQEDVSTLLAAARRGVEDTAKRGKLWLMLPDGETSYPENDLETMVDGLEIGTVEEVAAYQDVGSRWVAIIPTENPRHPNVRLFGTEEEAKAAIAAAHPEEPQ